MGISSIPFTVSCQLCHGGLAFECKLFEGKSVKREQFFGEPHWRSSFHKTMYVYHKECPMSAVPLGTLYLGVWLENEMKLTHRS